jgi:hypothetical protein
VTLGGNVWDREDTQRIQRFQHKARIGIKHVLPRKSKKKKGWKITLKLKKLLKSGKNTKIFIPN